MIKLKDTPFQKFLNELEPALTMMPPHNRLAFGASCCERAYPNYLLFSSQNNWGDPSLMRLGVDKAWEIACGSRADIERLKELESKLETITPDLDDFAGIETAAAQEAAFMARLLLVACHMDDPKLLVRIATFARDTVDLFAQTLLKIDPSDPLLEERVASHPLMERELRLQKDQLAALRKIHSLGELSNFKAQVTSASQSNVNLTKWGG